jgi:AbrB family looped-hinge helix DNA binding protein
MENVRTNIDDNGRILIPAIIRKQYHIKSGDVYVIRMIEDEMHLVSLNKIIKEAQDLVRTYIPENVSLVDELINDRRAQAEHEQIKFNNFNQENQE